MGKKDTASSGQGRVFGKLRHAGMSVNGYGFAVTLWIRAGDIPSPKMGSFFNPSLE